MGMGILKGDLPSSSSIISTTLARSLDMPAKGEDKVH